MTIQMAAAAAAAAAVPMNNSRCISSLSNKQV
jgi:hypothetical protein